jgi:hypothetical protein
MLSGNITIFGGPLETQEKNAFNTHKRFNFAVDENIDILGVYGMVESDPKT